MNKKLLIFLIFLIILGGLFYYFFRYKNLEIKNVQNKLKDNLKNIKEVKNETLKNLDEIKKEKVEKIEKKVGEYNLDKKNQIILSIKDKISDILLNFSKNLNELSLKLKNEEKITSLEDNINPAFQTAIVLKTDSLFSLVVYGPAYYEVDWGDGKLDKGEIKEEKTFILNHFFKDIGYYEIRVKIKKEKEFLSYSFPLKVY